MSQNINISLTKPQAEFLELQNKVLYALFTGGFGSGKSHVMASSAFLDALHSPQAWVTLYEPVYSHILDIAMPYVARLLTEHNIAYQQNKDEKVIWTNSDQIGNFRFRSMDNPETIVGYETYTSHVDELDKLEKAKADRVWNMILGRCRQWPKGLPKHFMKLNEITGQYEPRNKVCAYSTPEGFNFTYEVWAKNRQKIGTPEHRQEYDFIQCRTEDNPFVSQAYIDNLRAKYPEQLIDAYLNGEWVNLNSGTVYYAYDRNSHHTDEKVKPGETLHIGMDFNVGQMSGTVAVRRNGGQTWHVVDYMTGLLDTPDIIAEIKDRYPKHTIICYPDSSGNSRDTTNASTSDILQLKRAGFKVKARSKNPPVKDRVSVLNNAFAKMKIFINSNVCAELCECLEQQCYDKNNRPDKTQGHDHLNDALGYFAYYNLDMKSQIRLVNFSFANREY